MHQLDISFPDSPPKVGRMEIHARENRADNQQILEDNKEHFTEQCMTMIKALIAGEVLTTQLCSSKYNIIDGRARKRDLKKFNNIDIKDRIVKGRFKEFYLEPIEIERVKKLYNL